VRFLWRFILMPLLFTLVGTIINFSTLSSSTIQKACSLVFAGQLLCNIAASVCGWLPWACLKRAPWMVQTPARILCRLGGAHGDHVARHEDQPLCLAGVLLVRNRLDAQGACWLVATPAYAA
jgi:hypothetical protein